MPVSRKFAKDYFGRGDTMEKVRKGDVVTRNSYGNDILFVVENIVRTREMLPIAILKGVTLRIEASAYIDDLKIENRNVLNSEIKKFNDNINTRAKKMMEEYSRKTNTRKEFYYSDVLIMHLDGDKKYAEKSLRIYEKFKLNAIVKNIKENKQPYEIEGLLNKYNPDIVVITGHDGMIKKGYRYNDVYNYRNSRYFIQTVQKARRWEQGENKLAIFAGACQSYYEALIEVGANFASSPARILIDFMDPIVVAQNIAITPDSVFLRIEDVESKLRDGERGISGVGTFGKRR